MPKPKKVMTWVFRGGAILDIPLADDANVRVQRNTADPGSGYSSIEWKSHGSVSLASCCPDEVVAVIVKET